MLVAVGFIGAGAAATPLRPSAYITREAAFTPAFEFARAELTIAAKTSTQPPPQNTIPRSRQGFAAEVATLVNLSKPVPITHAYEHRT